MTAPKRHRAAPAGQEREPRRRGSGQAKASPGAVATAVTDPDIEHDATPPVETDEALDLDSPDLDEELAEELPEELPEDLPEDLTGELDPSLVDGGEDGGDVAFGLDVGATLPMPVFKSESRPATQDTLRLYLKEISAFPMLEPDMEFELARRVREKNDPDAAFKLVTSHLRLVVKIAMDFQRRWMQNVLDLVQEGNVGLMRAVQKFDPEKGIKFSYYSAFWIKAYILKFIMDNWRLVKIGTTQAQRKLFYNLNKERRRLQSLGFDPDTATLSQNLNVSVAEVQEMEQRLGSQDMSLDTTLADDSTTTRLDVLPAVQPSIEDVLAREEISVALQGHLESILPRLSEKERDILEHRLLADSPVTLREIGEKYGITRERVRQLETRLLTKLRSHLAMEINDFSTEWIVRSE